MTPFLSGLGGNSAIPRRLEANRRLPRQEHSPAASLPLTVPRAGEPLGFVLLSPSALPTTPRSRGRGRPGCCPSRGRPPPWACPGGRRAGGAAPCRAVPAASALSQQAELQGAGPRRSAAAGGGGEGSGRSRRRAEGSRRCAEPPPPPPGAGSAEGRERSAVRAAAGSGRQVRARARPRGRGEPGGDGVGTRRGRGRRRRRREGEGGSPHVTSACGRRRRLARPVRISWPAAAPPARARQLRPPPLPSPPLPSPAGRARSRPP